MISEGLTFDSEINLVAYCVRDYFAHIFVGLDEYHCSGILLRKSGPSCQAFVVSRVEGEYDIPVNGVPEGFESFGMYECHV